MRYNRPGERLHEAARDVMRAAAGAERHAARGRIPLSLSPIWARRRISTAASGRRGARQSGLPDPTALTMILWRSEARRAGKDWSMGCASTDTAIHDPVFHHRIGL